MVGSGAQWLQRFGHGQHPDLPVSSRRRASCSRRPAPADILNLPSGQTNLDFVTVGNPGNTADPKTGLGAVGYTYQIGTYDVTAAQYVAFLNAVSAADTYGLYNSSMSDTAGCNIQQSGLSGSYTYSVAPQYANLPVNYITWGDAARFCNWLTNGQPTGSENLATTENGSYYLQRRDHRRPAPDGCPNGQCSIRAPHPERMV